MQKESLVLDPAWQFKEFPESARRIRDLDSGNWLSATVPASIFTCLNQNNILSQQELISRPDNVSWVSLKNWVFRKDFDVSPALLDKEHIEIVFEGLDTIAHIWLNGKLIGKTDNMFIPHRFDIKPYLKRSGNTLYIKFISALDHTDRLLGRYGKLGENHLRDPRSAYIRKAQYQFTSSHEPSLTGCGIFRNVRIEGSNTATIKNLYLRTVDCNQHYADIRVALELNRINHYDKPLCCRITMTGGGLDLQQELLLESSNDSISTILHIDRPFLWWPHGYGIAHLYHVKVELLTDDGQVLDTTEQDFGVRTVRITGASDKTQLVINDLPIRLKGADWMPLSLFPGTLAHTHYEDLLQKTKSCHLNMLRVWAGGYYEDPAFYQLCDRMGILVWQDFMFDIAYYPDRQWFLDSVEHEAKSIIKRLRNYACIALWCGNNEIDQLHKSRKLGKGRKFYGKSIYHKLLPGLVNELDPDRTYIPTTPGVEPENCNLTKNTPEIPSVPNSDTLLMLNHDRNSFEMLKGLAPDNSILQKVAQYQIEEFWPPKTLPEYIWQSQVVQARRIQNAVETIRTTDSSGNSCCLHSFNDFALSVSSSMVDASRQPKALYYYAKRFFAPLLITLFPKDDAGTLKAYLINDTASPVTGVLCCQMMDTDGKIIDHAELPIRLSPFSKVAAINLPKSLSTPKEPTRTFLTVYIKNNDTILAENTFFSCPDKAFQWPVADLDIQIERNTEEPAWDVTLTSEVVVRDLQIIPPQMAEVSDNFLMLLPNQPKKVQLLFQGSPPPLRTPLEIFSTNQACYSD